MSEVTKPVFNPEEQYRWNPEDKFELSGQEFAFFYNYLNVKKVEAIQTLEMFKVMEQKLIQAVESGVAVVNTPTENESPNEA